jgi:hypothetical protein
MDDIDIENALVLSVFGVSIVGVVVGYFLAWRSNRGTLRTLGSLIVAAVAGFAGLFMSAWLMGAIMPLPPPDGSPLWQVGVFVLIFSPLPVGAFYICAKFIRRALGNQSSEAPPG